MAVTYTSRQVARKLGIAAPTLSIYIKLGKVPKPKSVTIGGITIQMWTDKDVERLRKLLPKIVNGRKTRWQKEREKQAAQAGTPTPAPRKTSKRKREK
jgi:predicted DNA-binding transcriptional regulator AlpA